MINYTQQTLQKLIDGLMWFDLPNRLKEMFKKLTANVTSLNDRLTDIEGNSQETPYKIYSALITQEGTNAPVAVELENTLGEVTFGYTSTGLFSINSPEIQKHKNKVTSRVNQNYHLVGTVHFVNKYITILKNISDNNVTSLTLQQVEHRMFVSDGSFSNFSKVNDITESQALMIEIKVYN